MFVRSFFGAALLAATALAGPPLTTIQDVLYKADGTRFNGTLTIAWSSFQAVDRSAIVTQTTSVKVVDGSLRVQLVPTTSATPAVYYTVTYNSDGRIQFKETWAVPSSAQPLRVRDVRTAEPAASGSGGQAGSDTAASRPIDESDVVGLIADLGVRPTKGPGYASGRVAVVNATGSLESVTGSPSDCVRVDGSSGPCGESAPAFVDGDSPPALWTAPIPPSHSPPCPTPSPAWPCTAMACCKRLARITTSTAGVFNSFPPPRRSRAIRCSPPIASPEPRPPRR